MTRRIDNISRLAAVAMLRAGTASPTEVAALAGVSRQLVYRWAQLDHVMDWQARRMGHLALAWDEEVTWQTHLEIHPPVRVEPSAPLSPAGRIVAWLPDDE
jgi:hypothetical protein